MSYRLRQIETLAYNAVGHLCVLSQTTRVLTRALDRLPEHGGAPLDVLVLCQGNVCRSPYAEIRLATELRDVAGDALRIHSAGLLTTPGKPAHPVGCAVAARRGVDLSEHLTIATDAEQLAAADLVLIMDPSHRRRLARLARRQLAKAMFFCAPAVDRTTPLVVPDPYDLPETVFEACFDQLDVGVAALARELRARVAPERKSAARG